MSAARATAPDTCRNGHARTPRNTANRRRPDGRPWRLCRDCDRQYRRDYQLLNLTPRTRE